MISLPWKSRHAIWLGINFDTALSHFINWSNSVLFESERSTVKTKFAKIGFVVAAGLSFLFSVGLWFTGNKDEGAFVGLWVPSILSFGTLVLTRGRNDG